MCLYKWYMINSIVKVLFENLLECDFSVIGKKKNQFVTMRDCRFFQAALAHNIGWNWLFNIELIFYLSSFGTGHPFYPPKIQTLKYFKRLNWNFEDGLRWEGRINYKNVCPYILFLYSFQKMICKWREIYHLS